MACTRNDRFVRAHLAHGALRRGRTACAPRFRFRRNGAPVPEIWVRIGKFTLTGLVVLEIKDLGLAPRNPLHNQKQRICERIRVLLTPACSHRDTRLFSASSKSSPARISSSFCPIRAY